MAVLALERGTTEPLDSDLGNSSNSLSASDSGAMTFAYWEARSSPWEMPRRRLSTAIRLAEMATAEASQPLSDETTEQPDVTRLGHAARVVTAIAVNGSTAPRGKVLQRYMQDFVGIGDLDRPLTVGGVDEMIREGSIIQGWLDGQTQKLLGPQGSPLALIECNGDLDIARRDAESDAVPGLRILGVLGQRQFDVFERLPGAEIKEWPHLRISGAEIGPYAAATMVQIGLTAHHKLGSSLAEVAASRPPYQEEVLTTAAVPTPPA